MAGGGQRRERKVVTVVFCDLVGFTARAESLDPEDVDALLGPYHERVRAELERHGGTVEKFIGDAVMALFGAPTAHEDDPERAVRAALAIRDFALEEELELRVGITTGEALVRLDAQPEAGEGMASGDVVNTAARLQSGAPVNGILVDETTFRATRQVVDYDEPQTIEGKGKSLPISVRRALEVRSRPGVDVAHEPRSRLVGRDEELSVLRDAFNRCRTGRTSQLVTLVGVPGIGKSRLVHEVFSKVVVPDPDLITWRQGRCLAYGDGVTLWALSEIVKAQAGIHEQDPPDVAAAKIRSAVEAAVTNTADVSWIESNVLALVGLAGESELGGDRRGEAFSAWRHFFEAMAEQRPLVLVVEDLHWADESLLDFVDELVDWVTDVPLLVISTARPELLERRPGWGGGKLNATTLALAPLSDEQTARLIAQRIERPLLAAESQQALLERAGGNPLYAEQFAELYLERGSADDLPLPETLQGIIAARLDGLAEDEKELLRDAAVVGKIFWIAALGRDAQDAGAVLHGLERKGFVRRQRRTSVEDEAELAFAHALVRDVAYGQIARADRAGKHRRVAEWIESLGRPEDHAEMLAYHWSAALDLTRASGADTSGLVDPTRLALREAGDRAFALNSFSTAERYYSEALELWPDDPERAELLFRHAHALYYVGGDRVTEALSEACEAALAAGDTERAAEAEALLAHVLWHRGDTAAGIGVHLERATALAGGTPSPAKARVLCVSARIKVLTEETEAGVRIAEEALEMATTFGLDELRAHALTTIGTGKHYLDDPTGISDLERALEIALAIDSPIAGTIVNNLAVLVDHDSDGGILRSEELYAEAAHLAERFGDAEGLRFVRGNIIWLDWVRGRWDDALAGADTFLAEIEAGWPHVTESYRRVIRAHILLGRGDTASALADLERALDVARGHTDPEQTACALAISTGAYAQLGTWDIARALAEELVAILEDHPDAAGWESFMALWAEDLGVRDPVHEAVSRGHRTVWTEAVLRAIELAFETAAEIYARMGSPTLEAVMRSAAGAHLLKTGMPGEGQAELSKALAFWRTVDATFYIERDEALLHEAKTA